MSDRNRIRMEQDITRAADPSIPIINKFTGGTPIIQRGKSYQVELIVMDNGSLDPSVGSITSITLEIKTYLSPTTAPLVSKTVALSNAGLTDPERLAATSQHALVTLDSGDTKFDMSGADASNNKNFSLIITAVKNGQTISLGDGRMVAHNDGGVYDGVNTPVAGDPNYLTAAQTLALLAGALNAATIVLQPGGRIILPNAAATKAVELYADADGTLQSPTGPYTP